MGLRRYGLDAALRQHLGEREVDPEEMGQGSDPAARFSTICTLMGFGSHRTHTDFRYCRAWLLTLKSPSIENLSCQCKSSGSSAVSRSLSNLIGRRIFMRSVACAGLFSSQ